MKVGLVGCGRIAAMVHLPLLKAMDGIEVVAAADVTEKNLHQTAEKCHIKEEYTDYQTMLEKADVDAVFVCTPPETHFRIIMDSISHGKHVFCEKPLVCSVDEGNAIKEALIAEQKKTPHRIVLMPGHNFIFTPCFSEALKLVKNGEIGNLQRIVGITTSNLTFYGAKTDFRMQTKGGVIEDQLPHILYLCHEVGGPAEKICSVETRRKGRIAIDEVNLEVQLEKVVTASLSAKWTFLSTGFIPKLNLELIGEKGKISMELLRKPYNISVTKDGESKTICIGRRFLQYVDVLRSKHPSYMGEHKHFFQCVENGEQPRVSVEDGVELVRTLNAIMTVFEESPYSPIGMENVAVLPSGDDIQGAVLKSVNLLGDMKIKKDDLVVIKPNICYPKNLENMVITDPRVLETVINIAKTRSRNVFVVESDSVSGTADYRMRKTGMIDLIKRCEVEFLNLSNDDVEEHRVSGVSLEIPKTVLKADYFINVPKVKTNDQMFITIAMKNVFGALSNKKKMLLHDQLAEVLTYLSHTIKQDLIVVDGIVAMEGLGPIQGSPVDLGLIISGLNPVTVDAVCCQIMGINPYAVEPLWRAYKAGIGEINIKRIQVLGEPIEKVKRKFAYPVLSPQNIVAALKTRARLIKAKN